MCTKIEGLYDKIIHCSTKLCQKMSLICCCWHCYLCCALVNNTDSNKLMIISIIALYYDDKLHIVHKSLYVRNILTQNCENCINAHSNELFKVTGCSLLINVHEKILPSLSPCRNQLQHAVEATYNNTMSTF